MLLQRVRETPLESPQARKTNLKNCPGALLLLRLLPAAFFLSAIEACSPFVNDVPQTSRTFAPFQACNWTNRARATPLELLQTQNTDLKKKTARGTSSSSFSSSASSPWPSWPSSASTPSSPDELRLGLHVLPCASASEHFANVTGGRYYMVLRPPLCERAFREPKGRPVLRPPLC